MKKLILTILLGAFAQFSFAQESLHYLNYQGAARTSQGLPLGNRLIGVRISILDKDPLGEVLYWEYRQLKTNSLGLFAFKIGDDKSSRKEGNLSEIEWGNGEKYIRIEIDPNGGSSWSTSTTVQISAVPIASYAHTGGTSGFNYWKALPENRGGTIEGYMEYIANMGKMVHTIELKGNKLISTINDQVAEADMSDVAKLIHVQAGKNIEVTGDGTANNPFTIVNTYIDGDSDDTNELLKDAWLEGTSLKISDNGGVKTVDLSPLLKPATKTTLGTVKIGKGLNIAADGTLDVIPPDSTLKGDVIGTFRNNRIADNAIKTAYIKDNAVTTEKIADQSITKSKLSAGAGADRRIGIANAQGEVNYEDMKTAVQGVQKTTSLEDGLNTKVSSVTTQDNTAWKVDVATANGNKLGVVKEHATKPTVSVNTEGELSLNLENINSIAFKNQDYQMVTTDNIILGDASTQNITITLPDAVGNKGKKITIKKLDGNEDNYVNVNGDIKGLQNGATGMYTALPYTGWVFVSDGNSWQIINKF